MSKKKTPMTKEAARRIQSSGGDRKFGKRAAAAAAKNASGKKGKR